MYTAIVLTSSERKYLLTELIIGANLTIPVGFELLADHCTLNMGKNDRYPKLEGRKYGLRITGYAANFKVIAVRVEIQSGCVESLNKTAHITIAVNRHNGGKPFHSNELTEWTEIKNSIMVMGKLIECQ